MLLRRVAFGLDFAGAQHAIANRRRAFHFDVAAQFFVFHRGDFDVDVDAVEQRAGNFRDVTLDLHRRAVAFARGIAEESAGARVHRGGEHEARRKIHGKRGAGDRDAAVFERLAHDFQHVALKFRQLVEKQNAVVPSETSPGRGIAPPPIRPASLMVWCGERYGRVPTRPRESSSTPATLWMRVVSIASSRDIGGRIVGMRFASMVFPAPGGPISRMLWLPAQATSSARFADIWPRTSRMSTRILAGLGEHLRRVHRERA